MRQRRVGKKAARHHRRIAFLMNGPHWINGKLILAMSNANDIQMS